MKQFIPTILAFMLLLWWQPLSAQESLSAQNSTSLELTSFETQSGDAFYRCGKALTISGGIMVASGALCVWACEMSNRDNTTDVVENGLLSVVGLMQCIAGGLCISSALPFYLWGWDIAKHPNGMSLNMGNTPQSVGGRLDVGGGSLSSISIGCSMGYNLNSRLFVGVGAAFEQRLLGDIYDITPETPVYADLRLRLGNSRIAPFVGLKGGFDLSNAYIPYGNIDWGVSYKCSRSTGAWWYALSLSTSYNSALKFKVSRSF